MGMKSVYLRRVTNGFIVEDPSDMNWTFVIEGLTDKDLERAWKAYGACRVNNITKVDLEALKKELLTIAENEEANE